MGWLAKSALSASALALLCAGQASAAGDKDLRYWMRDPALRRNPAAPLVIQADNLVINLDTDESIPIYTHALRVDPKFGPAYRGRACAYTEMNKMKEALADYTKAIECDPIDESLARRNRAELNAALKNYAAAIPDLNIMLDRDPRADGLLSLRAKCYLGLKKYDLALVDLNKAIKRRGTVNFLLRERAQTYSEAHMYDKALADYTTMIEQAHKNDQTIADISTIYSDRAKVYDATGKKELAKADRQKALDASEDTMSLAPFRVHK